MKKIDLLFIGPVGSHSGYGAHARDIVLGLIKSDKYDVKIIPTLWGMTPSNYLNPTVPNHKLIIDSLYLQQLQKQPDILVQLGLPTEFNPIGKYNIGITAGVETDRCSSDFITGMNRMNMVLVPSNFVKNVFLNTKFDKINSMTKQVEGLLYCTTPIEVLFEGADIDIYIKNTDIHKSVNDELSTIPETFVFLFVGHWLPGSIGNDRKDLGMLIHTFFNTFKNHPDAPALVLKTSRGVYSSSDREDVLQRIDSIRNSFKDVNSLPNVYLLHGELTDNEMNSLYNHPKVKVHISFTHGEGFGRPILEASLSGKPIIVPAWSGHLDFLKPEFSTLMSGKMIQLDQSALMGNILIEGSHWFQTDYNYASQVMKDIKRNYKLYAEKAIKQKNYSRDNFSLDKMHEKLNEIFDKYIPEIPTEMQIQLPQLDVIELPILEG